MLPSSTPLFSLVTLQAGVMLMLQSFSTFIRGTGQMLQILHSPTTFQP